MITSNLTLFTKIVLVYVFIGFCYNLLYTYLNAKKYVDKYKQFLKDDHKTRKINKEADWDYYHICKMNNSWDVVKYGINEHSDIRLFNSVIWPILATKNILSFIFEKIFAIILL